MLHGKNIPKRLWAEAIKLPVIQWTGYIFVQEHILLYMKFGMKENQILAIFEFLEVSVTFSLITKMLENLMLSQMKESFWAIRHLVGHKSI